MPGLHRRALIATGASLAAVISGVVVPAYASPTSRAAASGQCAQVWFIGARGSGEKVTKSTDGMGPEVYDMYQAVRADLTARGIPMAKKPLDVDYAAASVDVLKPDATVMKLLEGGDAVAAAAWWVHTSVDRYDASLDDGIKQAEDDVAGALRTCPGARIILAGYSQGAAAIHDAENYLAKNKPAEFAHVAGTLLLGDPDRVKDTKARAFGTEPANGQGLRVYLCLVKWLHICLVKPDDVPDPATTAEIADRGDIVANFDWRDITSSADRNQGMKVHTTYASRQKKLLARAANWVASLIHSPATWTAAQALLPANAASDPAENLEAISCPSATYCVAAGSYLNTSGEQDGLLVTWSDGRWTAAEAPLPPNVNESFPYNALFGISCVSASFCVAVGNYENTSAADGVELLTWSGGSWTAADAPVPADAVSGPWASLTAVSCASASFCVAAGSYQDTSGDSDGMLLTRAGGSWSATRMPLPANASESADTFDTDHFGVSCPSATFCTVAGMYEAGHDSAGLLVTYSGGSWTAIEAPIPANAATAAAASASLSSVSCPSASFCTAAGQYVDDSGDAEGLLVTLSGGSWKGAEAPIPNTTDSGPYTAVSAISCVSATFCAAAGLDSAAHGVGLTEAGDQWTAVQLPLPGNATSEQGGQYGVSCPSASFCVAVSSYFGPSAHSLGLLLTWGPGGR
jgi:Cutinase